MMCSYLLIFVCQRLLSSNSFVEQIHFLERIKEYEENKWCVEFGHLVDAHGISAHEACCTCGGGLTEEDGDEPEL